MIHLKLIRVFISDPIAASPKNFAYEKYIRNFFRDSLIKEPIEYILERPNSYEEKPPMLGSTSQLNKYSDEFLKKFFEDIITYHPRKRYMFYIRSEKTMEPDNIEPIFRDT